MVNVQETIFDLAYKGLAEPLYKMYEKNPLIITERDKNQRLLIHWAALTGQDEIVQKLLELGSAVDPTDDIGMSPLILASLAGKHGVVCLLIEKGADVNLRNDEGHSPLQYSCSKGWSEIAKKLLLSGANVNIRDKRGATPLHRAASRCDEGIVRMLLQVSGVTVDAQDVYGYTPLHLACEHAGDASLPVIKLLIESGASTDITNKEEKTPFELGTVELMRKYKQFSEKSS